MKNNKTQYISKQMIIELKMSDCLEVCIKISGCNLEDNKYNKDTHKICKLNNPDSYNKLNEYFE